MENKYIIGLALIFVSIILAIVGSIFFPEFNKPVPTDHAAIVTLVVVMFMGFGFGIGLLVAPETKKKE